MAAPQDNQYWRQRLSFNGKPPSYTPETLAEKAIEYFEHIQKNPFIEQKPFFFKGVPSIVEVDIMRPFTILGFCLHADICHNTWRNYTKKKAYLRVTTRIEEIIKNQKFEGAAAKQFDSNIIARDLGLIDKQQTDSLNYNSVDLTPAKMKKISEFLDKNY